MKLLTAKEVCNITKTNIRNTVLDQVMSRIINAAKNGQYGLKIRNDYTEEEVNDIFTTLLDLGYDVHTETQKYIGTLKTFTDITINWHD